MATLTHSANINPARRPRAGALSFFLGISFLVHLMAVFIVSPAFDREHTVAETLEVTLVRIEPPRVIDAQSRSAPPAPKRKMEKPQQPRPAPVPERRELAPAPQPGAEAPAPPLPEAIPIQQPTASTTSPPDPQPRSPAPEGKTDITPRQDAARAATPAPAGETPPALKAGPATSPSFSASYLRNPVPRYPMSARRSGQQGTVTLKVLVTRDGVAASVGVEKTSGVSALDQAAVEAVRSWRFMPARQGTQAVEGWVLVPIVFKLEGVS